MVIIEDVVCHILKLLLILIMSVRLISDFVIFHDHLSNCQVQDKERANNYAGDKVDDREALRASTLVEVHHWCPPIHSHYLENSKQSKPDVVKIIKSPEKILYVSVGPKIRVIKFIVRSIRIEGFKP